MTSEDGADQHLSFSQPRLSRLAYLELGVDNLNDDVLVGEPDDEPVLGSVVLVLGLRDETLSGVVWSKKQWTKSVWTTGTSLTAVSGEDT
jgi:hypothetical protein